MKLARIGQGRWTVLAACRVDRSCPLFEFLSTIEVQRANRIIYDLETYVPATDPTDWARSRFSGALAGTDGVFEFRWPAGRGGTPRVFWFFDEGRIIVCTHGLDKKGAMPAREIERARQIRREYLAAKQGRRLEIVAPAGTTKA